MICRKKNGHLKMSLRVGGLLCLILCLVFSLFSSTLNASATSVSVNVTNYLLKGGTTTSFYPFSSAFNNVVGSSAPYNYDNNKGLLVSVYNNTNFGLNRVNTYTNQFYFSKNTAVVHGEFNLVCSTRGGTSNCGVYNLDNLGVSYVSINDNFGPTILSSNVYAQVTDWAEGTVDGYRWANKTITFYYDFVMTGFSTGTSYFSFRLGNITDPILYFYNTSGSNASDIFIYPEKNDCDVTFYDNTSDAINQATNNILNIQNQILEWQRQHEIEQYELERQREEDFQNRSDSSSTDGDNATSSAENATSSLLGAITNIYGVLLHPTSSNCNIGPINIYNQLDLGTLDMCTFNIPQPIMAIGALLLIGLVILLAWSVLNAGMSLYKDLFGGKS